MAEASSELGPWQLLEPAAAHKIPTSIPPQLHKNVIGSSCLKLVAREDRRRCILSEQASWGREHLMIDWNSTSLGMHTGWLEKERSSVVYHGGQYHLFFQCWRSMVNPAWIQRYVARTDMHPESWPELTDSTIYHEVYPLPSSLGIAPN